MYEIPNQKDYLLVLKIKNQIKKNKNKYISLFRIGDIEKTKSHPLEQIKKSKQISDIYETKK